MGYAKFDLEQPALNFVLNEMPGHAGEAGTGALSHLGLQVGSTDDVLAVRERVTGAGLRPRDEMQVSCCYARQDKFWVEGAPNGERWEVYTVLEDSETFSADDSADTSAEACCTNDSPTEPAKAAACC